MKYSVFLILPLILARITFAQHLEYAIHLNSGLSSFGGKSAVHHSFIIMSDVAAIDNYTNNPYGKKKTLSYGLGGQIQYFTNLNLIAGIQAGYEILRSRVGINGISGEFSGIPQVTSGETTLYHGFMNLYPHAGKRIHLNKTDIDLMIGPEFGFNTFSREKGRADIEDKIQIETNTERHDPGTDVRIRPSLSVSYKSWGITAGYSYGLKNYSENLIGADRKRFSRCIRFGITYRIQ